jgi:hypothetical protein
VKGRVALLLVGSLAFWLVLAIPARSLWGHAAVWHSLAAAGLCLVPTAATLLAAQWATRQPPELQLVVVVFGTLLRMFFVLAAGLVIYFRVPFFQDAAFWVWILVFYLFTLALEMTLLLTRQAPAGNTPG